jgi:hypothetical protein
MAQLRTLLRALLGLTFFPSSLWAEPPTELLPAPPPVLLVPAAPVFAQPNPYDVWQAYGVARDGHFRPLVVLTPAGPFRVADGAYYPFLATHQRDVVPVVTDSLGPVPPWPAPPAGPVHVRRRWLR